MCCKLGSSANTRKLALLHNMLYKRMATCQLFASQLGPKPQPVDDVLSSGCTHGGTSEAADAGAEGEWDGSRGGDGGADYSVRAGAFAGGAGLVGGVGGVGCEDGASEDGDGPQVSITSDRCDLSAIAGSAAVAVRRGKDM